MSACIQAENDWKGVAARLSDIRDRLLSRGNLLLNLSGDSSSLRAATEGQARRAMLDLVTALPESSEGSRTPATATSGSLFEALNSEPLWVRDARKLDLLGKPSCDAYTIPAQVSAAPGVLGRCRFSRFFCPLSKALNGCQKPGA